MTQDTPNRLAHIDLQAQNEQLKVQSPQDRIAWAQSQAPGRTMALACSLSAEDVVLLHMLQQQNPDPYIFVLDTGRLHEPTYSLIEKLR
ncbi:MAG: phosphoadenosine phosphosulfate reductase family protein, partial [Myxococcota bacterium]